VDPITKEGILIEEVNNTKVPPVFQLYGIPFSG
jgi:hypothetical protein